MFPSLRAWTHPVTGSSELVPEQASRHFGARREGIERPECGDGHCGVDLDGPRGRPLVAVAAGTVVRVERSELGLDGRSGRYVRIEHDDGTLTAYMHMDDVAEASASAITSTPASTSARSARPPCSPRRRTSTSASRCRTHPGLHGDNTNTHYVDPAPFLARSTIAPVARPVTNSERERRHAIKPAF